MVVSAIVKDVQRASLLLNTGGARIILSSAFLEHLRVSVPACDRGRDSITMSSSAKNSAALGVKLRARGQVSTQLPIL
jgi:hypothetical protein